MEAVHVNNNLWLRQTSSLSALTLPGQTCFLKASNLLSIIAVSQYQGDLATELPSLAHLHSNCSPSQLIKRHCRPVWLLNALNNDGMLEFASQPAMVITENRKSWVLHLPYCAYCYARQGHSSKYVELFLKCLQRSVTCADPRRENPWEATPSNLWNSPPLLLISLLHRFYRARDYHENVGL